MSSNKELTDRKVLDNVDYSEFSNVNGMTLYINDMVAAGNVLSLEEEKKYGHDLKLRDKITIYTEKKYLNKNNLKVIDLERIFVSLDNNPDADFIIDTLLSFYGEKQTGIGKIISDYLLFYKDLCKKLGHTPNREELSNYFNQSKFNGIFYNFRDVVAMDRKKLLKQVDYFIRYNVAHDKFINSNLRLVISIAKRYINSSLDLLDLISEGNIGLMKAVDKFDIDREIKFSTYATYWIKQGITRSLLEKGSNIKIPIYLRTDYNNYVKKLAENSINSYIHSLKDISKILGIPVELVMEYEKLGNLIKIASLDKPVGEEEEETLIDFVPDNSISPEDSYAETELSEIVLDLLNDLDDAKARKVLEMRFGLNGKKACTLEEIGKELKVSRERVRQIEAKALRKIRARTRYNKRARCLRDYL